MNAMRKRESRFWLPHPGQIITTKHNIIYEQIWNIDQAVTWNTVILIGRGHVDPDYGIRLYSVCSRLYFLSKLIYRDKDGLLTKLSAKRYEKELFEGFAENEREVAEILDRYDIHKQIDGSSEEFVSYVFHCLKLIEAIWCNFIACVPEQAYISEYAYAFEFVMDHKGKLPMPEYKFPCSLFPTNYEEFNYSDNYEYYDSIMISNF